MAIDFERTLDPREVTPGSSGVLFLVAAKEYLAWKAYFVRVRVIGDTFNSADMENVVAFEKSLHKAGKKYIAFSAGRNTPLPGNSRDMEEFMDQATKKATPSGVDKARKIN
jgi:hypothetical protein